MYLGMGEGGSVLRYGGGREGVYLGMGEGGREGMYLGMGREGVYLGMTTVWHCHH